MKMKSKMALKNHQFTTMTIKELNSKLKEYIKTDQIQKKYEKVSEIIDENDYLL